MKLTREFIRELINEEVSRMAGGKRKKVLKESIADIAIETPAKITIE